MYSKIGIFQWKNKKDFWHLPTTTVLKIQRFFGYVDSSAKIFLILYPQLENSTTRTAILRTIKLYLFRYACISPTRWGTPTAPQRFPNFPSSQKSLSNYSWQPISWIARKKRSPEMKRKKEDKAQKTEIF